MSYLLKRKNTFHYYRRTPKLILLNSYTEISTIKRTLSKDKDTAKLLTNTITDAIDKALVYIKLGLDNELITKTLSTVFISKGGSDIPSHITITPTPIAPLIKTPLIDKANEYVSTLSISKNKLAEYNSMITLLTTLLHTNLEEINYTSLDKVASGVMDEGDRKYRIFDSLGNLDEEALTKLAYDTVTYLPQIGAVSVGTDLAQTLTNTSITGEDVYTGNQTRALGNVNNLLGLGTHIGKEVAGKADAIDRLYQVKSFTPMSNMWYIDSLYMPPLKDAVD